MGMTVRDTTMLYLSQMMGKPVVDTQGEKIGTISDLAISTGEVFPRITSLAFQGPGKVPFMISWRHSFCCNPSRKDSGREGA